MRPTSLSSTSTMTTPVWACIRTRTKRPTIPSCPSASGTVAFSVSATRRHAVGPTPTSSSHRATCSCSAAHHDSPTTALQRPAPVPMRAARLPGGHQMSVKTVCLGWHWRPYKYTRTDDEGVHVAEFPRWMVELGRRALIDAYGDTAASRGYAPDVALINFYDDHARMGMHQDKDEKADDPVVSLSIGDSCVFRFGNTQTRSRPYTDIELASGDMLVFGGPSRFAYHGVTKTCARADARRQTAGRSPDVGQDSLPGLALATVQIHPHRRRGRPRRRVSSVDGRVGPQGADRRLR